jgi:hypothetical protein
MLVAALSWGAGLADAASPVPGGQPNYFGPEGNWANSPMPTVNLSAGTVSGGIRKFVDQLDPGTDGDLFIPVDTTTMGAGMGPDGMNIYTQNRAVIHLHGGNTPWISDGTPHQWITPANETSTIYTKGVGFMNVPDMVGAGTAIPNPNSTDGIATYYYPNQQSARLMFYHDHSLWDGQHGPRPGLDDVRLHGIDEKQDLLVPGRGLQRLGRLDVQQCDFRPDGSVGRQNTVTWGERE